MVTHWAIKALQINTLMAQPWGMPLQALNFDWASWPHMLSVRSAVVHKLPRATINWSSMPRSTAACIMVAWCKRSKHFLESSVISWKEVGSPTPTPSNSASMLSIAPASMSA
eukprot:5522036-Amphidinium_carterae.2